MSSGPRPVANANLIDAVDRALWQIYSVEQLMLNFSSDKQDAVNQKLVELNSSYQKLHSIARDDRDLVVEVPTRLLHWVDEGKSPDEFIQRLFTETLDLHQVRLAVSTYSQISMHSVLHREMLDKKRNVCVCARTSIVELRSIR